MNINTIEDSFKYQVKKIFERMLQDLKACESKQPLSDYMWDNREELGAYFFEAVDEYLSVDEIADKIENRL